MTRQARPPGARRKKMVVALVAGVVAGAAVGAALFTGAAPPAPRGPQPQILHAAPALVTAGRTVVLSAAAVCDAPERPSCRVQAASALVRPAGTSGWTRVPGRAGGGGFRFSVPGTLIPDQGFSYWLGFRTGAGALVAYPPAAGSAAFRVLTTAGLPTRSLAPFAWDDLREPDGLALRLPYGSRDGQVGRAGGRPEEPREGPSSFDVRPDGSIYVADWVNDRIQVFGPRGTFRTSYPAPHHLPMDLAVATSGRVFLSDLRMDGRSFELSKEGRLLGTYPIAFGVPSRISAVTGDPRVLVGPSQWTAVRAGVGVPLSAERQSLTEAASLPIRGGLNGVASELSKNRVAFAWSRPDGSRAGATLKLPRGVRAGSDFFVRPMRDGGALVARGLWDDTHFAVGLIRFDAVGRVTSFSLLPEPSVEQGARYSTVRFRPPGEVLVAYANDRAVTIDRFEVR